MSQFCCDCGCGCQPGCGCRVEGTKVIKNECDCANTQTQETGVASETALSCVPVLADPDQLHSGPCDVAEGGAKTVGAPQYVLTIQNPPSVEIVVWATTENENWKTTQGFLWGVAT